MASHIYDVVIVGSGAAGGTLSAHLARRGVDVALVEGGPKVNTRTDFNTHAMPFEFPSRHIPTMKPGKVGFDSERSRGVGGKTMLWNAVAWRFSERDFRGRDHDGAGENWPLHYRDMAPYYERIEREVGVCGNLDGLEDLPDGVFLPPVPMKCSDLLVKRGAAKLGVKVIHVRKSTLSRPMHGRPACHFCGNCMAGCDVAAKYNSADAQILPTQKAGYKLEVVSNAVVREVTVSPENRVTGVKYVHRETRQEGEVLGRTVVVSCACVQSVALLLMSRSRLYPTGLGNSSGELGKNFIPHFTGGVQCFLGDMLGKGDDEGFLDHAYIPSFMHNRKRDYARTFGVQFGYNNRRSVGWARTMPGFGKAYKESVKRHYPAFLQFSPYGEMIPNAGTYVDLDESRKDAFGLPLARRHVTYMENERKLYADMLRWSAEILKASGAEIFSGLDDQPVTNHELGGCRMGEDPKRSVLNAFCRSHDVPNLYVVDGSSFPGASEKNPTHTIMALAARTADNIADRLKRREI
jgi:choline dehydrogenase-like flavoprotein